MSSIRELIPTDVFTYFDEICHIPHGSDNIGQISDYCVRFAKEHALAYRQEACGNVIIWKEASPGYEAADTVMLQGHLDMVTVKTDDCDIDMEKEGLRPMISDDGEWIYAEGTSLGGDDGIAVAYALAILADDTLKHPALEAVLTVNEEIGLLGANALDASDLRSRILLNMDSEEEGIFLTSCAGGANFQCILPAKRQRMSGVVFELKIDGLLGGHSGSDIHLGRANANDLFGRFLTETAESVSYQVGDVSGGEKDNAIPNRCTAVLLTEEDQADALCKAVGEFSETITSEYAVIEPNLAITLTRTDRTEADVLTGEEVRSLRIVLEHMPAGVQRMEPGIPDMVQTSVSLGILRVKEEAVLTYLARSSVESQKRWLLQKMTDVAGLTNARCKIAGDYPGWEYLPDSKIRGIMMETYRELTGKEAELAGIHGGVECGIFTEKIPGIDAVSYGPEMRDIHTVNEKLNIASTRRTYELTCRVLEKL